MCMIINHNNMTTPLKKANAKDTGVRLYVPCPRCMYFKIYIYLKSRFRAFVLKSLNTNLLINFGRQKVEI